MPTALNPASLKCTGPTTCRHLPPKLMQGMSYSEVRYLVKCRLPNADRRLRKPGFEISFVAIRFFQRSEAVFQAIIRFLVWAITGSEISNQDLITGFSSVGHGSIPGPRLRKLRVATRQAKEEAWR